MATLTVQRIAVTGIDQAYVTPTATSGDKFFNSGKTFLEVKNGSASSINVTIDAKTPCDLGQDHDLVVAVGAGVTKRIGPFNQRQFNDSAGLVSVVCSSVATVQIAAVELP
ncbi:MAG: hypothetical protein LLG45_13320 [Actinomycetia bacterium]|nr:hypothetical protein [Actinomycetes bacterium]